MQVEFHQLDRRWEHLRVRHPGRQRRLLASLAESGQQTPIVVVAAEGQTDRFVVIDGYKRIRVQEVNGWRPRRSGFGELVQWDTSDHDWLEGRGPVRYLVRMIDDATSWSWGRFVESDAWLRLFELTGFRGPAERMCVHA